MKDERQAGGQEPEKQKTSLKTKIIMAVCAAVSFVLVASICVFLVIQSYHHIKETSPDVTTTISVLE